MTFLIKYASNTFYFKINLILCLSKIHVNIQQKRRSLCWHDAALSIKFSFFKNSVGIYVTKFILSMLLETVMQIFFTASYEILAIFTRIIMKVWINKTVIMWLVNLLFVWNLFSDFFPWKSLFLVRRTNTTKYSTHM